MKVWKFEKSGGNILLIISPKYLEESENNCNKFISKSKGDLTNGKLYVNWLNVIPMIDYKSSQIYKISNIELANPYKLILHNV